MPLSLTLLVVQISAQPGNLSPPQTPAVPTLPTTYTYTVTNPPTGQGGPWRRSVSTASALKVIAEDDPATFPGALLVRCDLPMPRCANESVLHIAANGSCVDRRQSDPWGGFACGNSYETHRLLQYYALMPQLSTAHFNRTAPCPDGCRPSCDFFTAEFGDVAAFNYELYEYSFEGGSAVPYSFQETHQVGGHMVKNTVSIVSSWDASPDPAVFDVPADCV